MLTKKINTPSGSYSISIFSIWKKSIFDNRFTTLDEKERYSWQIKPAFTVITHICSICKGLIWIVWIFSSGSVADIMPWNDMKTNLFIVILNLSIMIIPIILFEILLAHLTPIEINKRN